MTNRTLTALIVRLAGFALFIKIFDFFGSYFMSIYMSAQVAFMDESSSIADSFNKLYISGTILSFANLLLSIILILKADWIAGKMVKPESEIKIKLTAKSVMRIVIATIGIIYFTKTLYQVPTIINNVIEVVNWDSDESYAHIITGFVSSTIRAVIGVLFIFKSEHLANFAMKRLKSL